MATLVWALVCQRVLVDQPTNLVSYIDVLDGVVVPRFPLTLPSLVVTSLWQRGDESLLEMRVRVYSPSGEQLTEEVASSLKFGRDHRRGRMSVRMRNIVLAGPGRYEFGIETKEAGNWTEVSRVPLDVDPPPDSKESGRVSARTAGGKR